MFLSLNNLWKIAKHPTVHRTAPTTEIIWPKLNSAEAMKPCFKELSVQ